MKYWKGKAGTVKAGQLGTCDENSIVPDSVEATQAEYDLFVSGQTAVPEPDYVALYAAATTDAQRIGVIAQKSGLV